MNASELPTAIRATLHATGHTDQEILQHFQEKYPLIEHHGRQVFLFGQARDFGDKRHLVEFHVPGNGKVPEHIYSYVIITYCLNGTFPISIDGTPFPLQPGECLVRDRHVPNSVEATDSEVIAINLILADEFFEGRLLDGMAGLGSSFATELMSVGASHDRYRVYRTSEDEFVRTCVERILCEELEPDATSAYLVDFFLAALLTHLLCTYERDVAPADEAFQRNELMGTVRQYIAMHYQEGNLSMMASDLGYERTYLSKFVRQTTGSTFKQLVNVERMRRAALLLRGTTRPIYEIAEEVGLSNLTSFYQRFREWAGCTPQEYRTQR